MAANPSSFAHLRLSPPVASVRPLRVMPEGLPANSQAAAGAEPIERAPESRTFRIDSNSPDHLLAIAAAGGNPRAAAIIVRRYTPKVRSRIHHWIGPVDIDDHVQNAFIRLFQQLPRLRDPSALRGFLLGITLRIACSELRRRRRSRTHLTATGDVPEPPVLRSDSESAREALWRFESILGRLAPSSRRVFILRYVEKLELTDIAEEMGISVATVKRHFARAATAVSAMLKREPALAEYLPVEDDAKEREVSGATAGVATLSQDEARFSSDETGDAPAEAVKRLDAVALKPAARVRVVAFPCPRPLAVPAWARRWVAFAGGIRTSANVLVPPRGSDWSPTRRDAGPPRAARGPLARAGPRVAFARTAQSG